MKWEPRKPVNLAERRDRERAIIEDIARMSQERARAEADSRKVEENELPCPT